MKTAIILTGHMRSFERCLPTLHWHVFRHFLPNRSEARNGATCDFFISTIKDANSHKAELLREKYPDSRVEIDVVDAQPELPIPVGAAGWKPGMFYGHEPYAISVHPQAILRQLWQLQRGWDLMIQKNDRATTDHGYDVVIRCRPDLWFHSCEIPSPFGPEFSDYIAHEQMAYTPWWGRFGGVNDRFAILGRSAAVHYFSAFQRMPDLLAAGCPLHPESLLKASIEAGGCMLEDALRAEFSTLREDGTFRAPEAPLADQVHAAMSHA